MANIRIAIGPITAQLNATDALAADLVRNYNRANDAPDGLSNGASLQWFLRRLMTHAKTVGDELEIAEEIRDAVARQARDLGVFDDG